MIPAKDVRMGRLDVSRLTRVEDIATGPATVAHGAEVATSAASQLPEAVHQRGVEVGGQVIEVWHEQPEADEALLLRQVMDATGPDAVLSADPIRNGSRRVIGTRYTVTVDAAEAIRASLAAYQDTLGD